MPFHLESLCGATLMLHRGCGMDRDKTIQWGWVKLRSGFKPVVDQSSGNFRTTFMLSNPLPDCLCHASFSRYSPLSLEIVEKQNKCKNFWPPFFRERRSQLFYDRLLARPTVHRLAKCGWVPFADVRQRSLAMKWNADMTVGGWRLTSNLKPFVDQSSCRFETM